jgi:hypothetical protein
MFYDIKLKDKNNIDIYENDLLKVKISIYYKYIMNIEENYLTAKVIYNPTLLAFQIKFVDYPNFDYLPEFSGKDLNLEKINFQNLFTLDMQKYLNVIQK